MNKDSLLWKFEVIPQMMGVYEESAGPSGLIVFNFTNDLNPTLRSLSTGYFTTSPPVTTEEVRNLWSI